MKPLTQKCNKNLRHRFYAAKYRSGETSRNLFIEQPADCVAMIRGREGHDDIEDIIELLQCAQTDIHRAAPISAAISHISTHAASYATYNNKDNDNKEKQNKEES